MAQLHCYVSEAVARKVQERAEAAGLSTSRYIARLIHRDVSGGWRGGELTRPEQPQLEAREVFAD